MAKLSDYVGMDRPEDSAPEDIQPQAESATNGVHQPSLWNEIRIGHQGDTENHGLPQHHLFLPYMEATKSTAPNSRDPSSADGFENIKPELCECRWVPTGNRRR